MRRSGRGFTLVELLVVIAILAVLLSLLMPGLERGREMARASACRSNLRQIGVAIHSYTTDHGGRFPAYNRGPWTGDAGDAHWGGRHPGRQWDAQIAPYLGMTPGATYTKPTVFYCPSTYAVISNRDPGRALSYLYNRYLGMRGQRRGLVSERWSPELGGRDWFGSGSVHTLDYPDRTILTAEYHFYYYPFDPRTGTHDTSGGLDFTRPVVQLLWPQAANVSMGAIVLGQPVSTYYRQISFRHRDRTHILFADFSVDARDRISSNPRSVNYFIPNGVMLHNQGTYHSR